uniref:Neutrophil cytosol factor 1 C-terminal domain-containing protein n=1 Tax=Anguilla anguilla TaxID=7936 RepID=A0A0E9R9Y6_ANGAN
MRDRFQEADTTAQAVHNSQYPEYPCQGTQQDEPGRLPQEQPTLPAAARATRLQRKTQTAPLLERSNNSENIAPKPGVPQTVTEQKEDLPAIPPRPSPELILERCTEGTRKKVSIRKDSGEGDGPTKITL